MPATLDANGLHIQTLAEIVAEIEDEIRDETGNQELVFAGDSILGQFVAVVSRREFSLHELAAAIYDAGSIAAAPDVPLKALVTLGGLTANAATRSIVDAILTGTSGTAIPAGTLLSVLATSDIFGTDEDVVLAAVAAWTALTVYALGARRDNFGNVYQVTTAGTSAGAGGPSGTATAIVDGTVTWRYLGAGDAVVDVGATAQATGPVPAPVGKLSTIVTAVAGLSNATNLTAATLGENAETPAELRERYALSFHLPGKSTLNALLAQLLAVDEISEVKIYENPSHLFGANGIAGFPPHRFLAIVAGTATAQVIGDLVWENKPLGIDTWSGAPGAVAVVVTDGAGDPQTVYYSPPSAVNVDVIIAITGDGVTGPEADVEAAFEALLDAGGIGDPAMHWEILCLAADTARAGGYNLTGITVTLRRGAAAYAAANVAMLYYEKSASGTVAASFA